jgi:uncharacterized protein YciI
MIDVNSTFKQTLQKIPGKTKMKKFKFLATALPIILAFWINTSAQPEKSVEEKAIPKTYDAQLADELGADEYGMRSYVFVILKTGKAEITDENKRKELFAGHFANMGKLAKEGILVLAGPFMDGGEKRGLFVFDVKTIAEAQKLVETDPAVKAGIFEAELTRWYGSAALMKLNEIHTQIQKTPIQ